jgi:HSP20 family protein
MKLDLSKWNPFKFNRGATAQQQEQQSAPSNPQVGAGGFGDMQRLLDATDPFRVIQGVLRDPFAALGQTDRWFGNFSASVFQPRIDVVDDGEAIRITAELPGMDKQDLEVLVEDEFLVLRGEKKLESKNEEKGCYRVERSFGSFQRVLPLPDGVDVARADAKFDKGVLTLRLPKTPTGKAGSARKLEIK